MTHRFTILSMFPLACGLLACSSSDATDESAPATALVRVAHLSVEVPSVRFCVDGALVEPVGATPIRYTQATAYVRVAVGATLSVVAETSDCADKALQTAPLELEADQRGTWVLYGTPGSTKTPLATRLLADGPRAEPADHQRAKARNFHTDTEAGTIDVGVAPGPAAQLLVFSNVAYGQFAKGSTVGTLDALGYVDGIPTEFPLPRLNIWRHGTRDVLGWFPTANLPLRAGKLYTIFPAGRVATGTPEAVVCEDEPREATHGNLWASCETFEASAPDGG